MTEESRTSNPTKEQQLAHWRAQVDMDPDGCGDEFINLLCLAEELMRGEYICRKCGIRKDAEVTDDDINW